MHILQRTIEFIAPLDCIVCGHESAIICDDCLPRTIIIKDMTCIRCNRAIVNNRICSSCEPLVALNGVTVGAYYDGAIKQLIHALKYEKIASAANIGARVIASKLDNLNIDIITAVPTSPNRYRQRGYNQARLIGKALAAELDVPYKETLVRAVDIHQIGVNRAQRLKQVGGIFEPISGRHIKDQRILIVDDVITTGASVNECAKTLKAAGAASVWAAAIAKH